MTPTPAELAQAVAAAEHAECEAARRNRAADLAVEAFDDHFTEEGQRLCQVLNDSCKELALCVAATDRARAELAEAEAEGEATEAMAAIFL